MQPCVSIIIPVYKVEFYMDECIQSVCDLSLKNIEILLVDDGPPDSSGIKCDLWAKKDKRIRVFHKTNEGLSDARNYGIDLANREDIAF